MKIDDAMKVLKHLPPDAEIEIRLTVADVRKALAWRDPGRELSTAEAAQEFGRTADWWSRRAEDVPGAWQETEGAPWHLPRAGCESYLVRLRRRSLTTGKRRGLRGPNQTLDASAA